jgi:uncharacterized protein
VQRLDVRRFAEDGATLEAASPLAGWPRLQAESTGGAGEAAVHWQATGELRGASRLRAQPWIHLEASAVLQMACQRCLHPVEVPVELQQSFRFAPDEATAAAEDDAAEEDVLAESAAFDLVALVEDELLMALPPVPRHAVCPEQLPVVFEDADFAAAQADKPNPFAVLGKLKQGGK